MKRKMLLLMIGKLVAVDMEKIVGQDGKDIYSVRRRARPRAIPCSPYRYVARHHASYSGFDMLTSPEVSMGRPQGSAK